MYPEKTLLLRPVRRRHSSDRGQTLETSASVIFFHRTIPNCGFEELELTVLFNLVKMADRNLSSNLAQSFGHIPKFGTLPVYDKRTFGGNIRE